MAGMSVDSGSLWDAIVDVMLAAGRVREGRSRYGDKPALFAGSREIAHLEQDGAIDLRITRAGWARARQDFAADPAVLHDPGRRDWIELRPKHASDLDRLAPLLAVTAAANAVMAGDVRAGEQELEFRSPRPDGQWIRNVPGPTGIRIRRQLAGVGWGRSAGVVDLNESWCLDRGSGYRGAVLYHEAYSGALFVM
jgi:hypothetical protein